MPEPLTVETLLAAITSATDGELLPSDEGRIARAVLGLIGERYVPRAAVLDLANGWDHDWEPGECDDRCSARTECASELRALTEQETRP